MSLKVTSELGWPWPGAGERHPDGFILILNHVKVRTWPSLAVGRRKQKATGDVRGGKWKVVYAGVNGCNNRNIGTLSIPPSIELQFDGYSCQPEHDFGRQGQ